MALSDTRHGNERSMLDVVSDVLRGCRRIDQPRPENMSPLSRRFVTACRHSEVHVPLLRVNVKRPSEFLRGQPSSEELWAVCSDEFRLRVVLHRDNALNGMTARAVRSLQYDRTADTKDINGGGTA